MKVLSYCGGFYIRALLFIKWKLVHYNALLWMIDRVYKFGRLTEIKHAVKETCKKNVSVLIDIHIKC